MGAAVSVRVVAVNGGHVIEVDKSKGIKTQLQSDSKAQQWEVERKDNTKPEVFALKNHEDGKYLRAPNGNSYTPCTTGDKQFWSAEPGEAPGSFWLKNLEFKDAYLCNSNGYQTANNVVYMWPKQQGWVRALTWYVRDVNAKGFLSLPTGAPTDSPEGKKAVEELKAKEAAVDAREKKVAEQEKQAQENEKKAKELEKKAKELADKEKELADADQQAKSVTEELEKREKEVLAREKAATGRPGSASGGVSNSTGSNGSLKEKSDHMERQKELDEREKRLEAREKEITQREQSSTQPNETAKANGDSEGSSANSTTDVEALQKENATLKMDLERLKARFDNSQITQHPEKRTVRGNRMSEGPAVGHHIPHVQPASRLPSGWDPHLMARFQAGKRAMAKSK